MPSINPIFKILSISVCRLFVRLQGNRFEHGLQLVRAKLNSNALSNNFLNYSPEQVTVQLNELSLL